MVAAGLAGRPIGVGLSLSDGAQFELTSDRGADVQTFYI